MSTIATISELLNLSNCQFRVYDLGRKIDKLSKEQFNKFELNQMPYPFPTQGQAFFAIAFWQKNSPEPYLWFIKLPLDEQGLLNQGARNHFIAIIIEALGSDLSVDPTEQQEELLKSNPYHFTPAQYKLAAINSILNNELKQPASQHYEHCQAYIKNQVPWQNWQSIAIQGIADFAERLSQENNANALIEALPHLPNEVMAPLSCALENYPLPIDVISALIQQYKTNNYNNTHYLRALATNSNHPHVLELIDSLLTEQKISEEILIILAGRFWLAFTDKQRLLNYLEALVKINSTQLFPAIFKDLVAIPNIRPILFQCMREKNRSEALAKAIGLLFNPA